MSHNKRRVYFSEAYSALGDRVLEGPVFKPDVRDPGDPVPGASYILVIPTASPSYLPYLDSAVAVVCEQGGLLAHLAIVCREIGIPYIQLADASKNFRDGEWIELVPNGRGGVTPPESGAGATPPALVMRMSPWPPPEDHLRENMKILRRLPHMIGKDYELSVEARDGGIWVSSDSLDRLIADVRAHPEALVARMADYTNMDEGERFEAAILTMALGNALLPMLIEAAGDRDLALSLIRSGQAYYLELDGEFSGSLERFGIPDGRMVTPQALKDRLEATVEDAPTQMEAALKRVKDRERAETIALLIRLLISAYEDKDRS
jgi:phosphohistidine swiveling domain-containing protein